MPRVTWKRLYIAFGILALTGLIMIASTWNRFPGAYIKNVLGIHGNNLKSADRVYEEFIAKNDLKGWKKSVVKILKSKRTLKLIVDNKEIFTASAAFGGGLGHKNKEGDRKTPEGEYYICTRNERSSFHLFLGLSYPGINDAERGLRDGLISKSEHDYIISAIKSGKCPLWETKLGGAVGIHGCGGNLNWTHGCIALDDPDIELLWNFCPIGTRVIIEP